VPLIDLGYRRWDGVRSSRMWRALAITHTGLQLVWRTVWLRRLLWFAWLPILPVGIGFFLYEQSITQPDQQRMIAEIMEQAFDRPDVAEIVRRDPKEARHEVWAQMLFAFFRYPQAINMVLLFGLVAPRIISHDLRSRAYLLYFSRPLSVAEYLIGKLLILGTLLMMTTTVPALIVYVFGLLLSPDIGALVQTWDFPLRILLASLVFTLPTASLAMLLSSFTMDSRYASFAWFTLWVLGWVTYGVLTGLDVAEGGSGGGITLLSGSPTTRLVSLYHALGDVQSVVFGILRDPSAAQSAIMLVSVLTIVSILVTYYRVASHLRA